MAGDERLNPRCVVRRAHPSWTRSSIRGPFASVLFRAEARPNPASGVPHQANWGRSMRSSMSGSIPGAIRGTREGVDHRFGIDGRLELPRDTASRCVPSSMRRTGAVHRRSHRLGSRFESTTSIHELSSSSSSSVVDTPKLCAPWRIMSAKAKKLSGRPRVGRGLGFGRGGASAAAVEGGGEGTSELGGPSLESPSAERRRSLPALVRWERFRISSDTASARAELGGSVDSGSGGPEKPLLLRATGPG